MKQLLKHSGWTIFMTMTQAITGLVVSLLSARLLGPAGRGAFSLALLLVGSAGFVANPCLYSAANYFLSAGKLPLRRLFPIVLLLGSLSGGLAYLMAYWAGVWWADGMAVLGQPTLQIVAVGAAAFSLSTTMNGILYGSRRVSMIAGWSVGSAFLYAALIVYLTRLPNPTVAHFCTVYVVTLLLDALAKTVMGGWGSWRKMAWVTADFKPLLQFGLSVYVGRIMMLLSQKMDTYLLYFFAGQVALGYYSIAASFGEQLWMLPTAVNLVMMTNIASREKNEAAALTISASQVVFGLAAFGALGVAGIGFWLIPFLYGAEYGPAVRPFLIMLPGIVAISSYMLIEPFFQSRGRPIIPVKITALSSGANLLLSLLLIRPFGMTGAATAYTLSYLFQLVLTGWWFNRLSPISAWRIFDLAAPLQTAGRLIQAQISARFTPDTQPYAKPLE